MDIFPCRTGCLPISVTTSASASTALPALGNYVRLVNEGSVACFVSIGVGSQTATLPNATPTVTSTPVLPGTDCILRTDNNSTTPLNISAITRSSTTTLLVMVGEGM